VTSIRLLRVPSATPTQPIRRDELLLMCKSPNPVPNRVVVAPLLSSCSRRGRTHIRVCTACRQGLDDVHLPVGDTRLPPGYLVYPPELIISYLVVGH
jgi:hypothetical protein